MVVVRLYKYIKSMSHLQYQRVCFVLGCLLGKQINVTYMWLLYLSVWDFLNYIYSNGVTSFLNCSIGIPVCNITSFSPECLDPRIVSTDIQSSLEFGEAPTAVALDTYPA